MNKTPEKAVKNLPQEIRRQAEDRTRLSDRHGFPKRVNPDKRAAYETRRAFPELK
ncbi:hypothetical protein [Oxalobacter paraformigenes]|uniref:Uncharacterized protein n=1 Tax=Oxalobacter paraformigenes TaxID=556268 RepID=C3X3C3_9BURK|nr:hypothetical protein [Oxalobacter paraformigenes]EEO27709.2 hypothetical protein OFAG_00862 [Oxalobacter paraformigenes]